MFIKKIMILKSENGKNSGVLRLTANGREVEGVLTLNFVISTPLSLVLNTGEINEISVLENECKFNFDSEFLGEAHCLLLENNTILLSGSTNNDLRKLSELQNFHYEKKAKSTNQVEAKPKDQYKSDSQEEEMMQAPQNETVQTRDYKSEQTLNRDNEKDKILKARVGNENKTIKSTSSNDEFKSKKKSVSQSPTGARDVSAQNSEPSAVINEGINYEGENFYIAVKPQLDEMFECYPTEERLQEMISNSKWVRVDCENEFYVVGLIYDESQKPEFICYGIPGTYPVKPPEEISDVCEWFPFDLDNKYGDGFWLIYQNALTGKCLRNS